MKPSLIICFEAVDNPVRSATLPLPAYLPQLHDAMDRARIPHDAAIRITNVAYFGDLWDIYTIDWLPDNPPIDKLNYLAQQLPPVRDMIFKDYYSFLGLLRMAQKPLEMDDILNLALNTRQVECIECRSAIQLGRMTLYQEKGICSKDSTTEQALEAGNRRISEEGGVLLPEGYYVWKTGGIRQEYQDAGVSSLTSCPGIIQTYVTSPAIDGPGKWMFLPASDEEIEECYEVIRAKNDSECMTSEIHCPYILALDGIHADFGVRGLNRLAIAIQNVIGQNQLPKYRALLEYACEGSEEHYCSLAESLDLYEFHPDIATPEGLARKYLTYRYAIYNNPAFFENTDLTRYGETLMEKFGYASTDYGLIRLHGEEPVIGYVEPLGYIGERAATPDMLRMKAQGEDPESNMDFDSLLY